MLQSITGEPAKPSGTFTLYLQFLSSVDELVANSHLWKFFW